MYIRAPSSLFQKVAYWQPVTVKWSPSPDFRQNFGRQKIFPLAMATKMVAAWSAEQAPWFLLGSLTIFLCFIIVVLYSFFICL